MKLQFDDLFTAFKNLEKGVLERNVYFDKELNKHQDWLNKHREDINLHHVEFQGIRICPKPHLFSFRILT